MTVRLFKSHIDSRTGAISRWVAGSSSSHRLVFLAYMSDVYLRPGGPPAVHEIFVLTRFSSRFPNPLQEYRLKRRVTRKVASLPQGCGRAQDMDNIVGVEMSLLVENVEVADALARLFNTVGHDELFSRHARGLGSRFDRALRCATAFVEPEATLGKKVLRGQVEVESTIFCREVPDLTIHSIFRVEAPPT